MHTNPKRSANLNVDIYIHINVNMNIAVTIQTVTNTCICIYTDIRMSTHIDMYARSVEQNKMRA